MKSWIAGTGVQSGNMAIGEGLQAESERFAAMVSTDDPDEGVNAWIERRQPVYRGCRRYAPFRLSMLGENSYGLCGGLERNHLSHRISQFAVMQAEAQV
jgi:hypothetical protein